MEKKKNIKKVLILLVMFIILLLIYEIVHIYAIFHSEVSGNASIKNGVWKITVNGTEISQGVETSFTIDQITTQENENAKEGKLAPGLYGNFMIEINPQNTDVSVKYEVTLDQTNLAENNFFKIQSIEEVQTGNTLIQTEENTYTGVIPLENIKNGAINKIKVNVEWNDDGTHDKEDTKIGVVYNSKIQIPVIVRVSQYLGEEITPFQ